jgi:hypothetical protein
MGKREDKQCREYRSLLSHKKDRLADAQERGVEALSTYDRQIAYGGNDHMALTQMLQLLRHQVWYFGEKVKDYDGVPQQKALFGING